MDAKQTLAAARRSKLQMEALVERRNRWQEMGRYHSGGGTEALAQLQRELDRRIDEAARQELAAQALIDALDDAKQREILRYRYLNGWEWKEIAARMGYSPDWLKHVHAQALRELGGGIRN